MVQTIVVSDQSSVVPMLWVIELEPAWLGAVNQDGDSDDVKSGPLAY